MAVLTDNDRAEEMAQFMRAISAKAKLPGEGLEILKPDLRAAINAVDDWVNDNAAAFNAALPVAARTALTTSQKAELLLFVVRRRFEVT